MKHPTIVALLLLAASVCQPAVGATHYKNFRVAIYVTRQTVAQWHDPEALAAAFANMNRQVKFDKVYLEVASGKSFITEADIDPIKKFFLDHNIEVSGATATNGNSGGNGQNSQGGSLSLSVQADRDYLKSIAELEARHFDEVILDDWYFTASKTASEIAAKGRKSWTQFRMEEMDEASINLLVKPAKAINPKIKLIIKYPNWYEHYQGLGYDLEAQPKIFDAIYTGVETRDPLHWEQHLQQYESYDIMRYLENVKPGGNGGGWVDTLFTRYIDRYPEQIWDTAFSKPKEITLWQWNDALTPMSIGTRPWSKLDTSFNLQNVIDAFHVQQAIDQAAVAPSTRPADNITDARNGRAASNALEQVDSFLSQLGTPIGVACYRPPHATGDEFCHEFMGMIGFPIDLHPTFPADSASPVFFLTESAKADPDIVAKIKTQLAAGKYVTITSGLFNALQGKGIEDITELQYTDKKVAVTNFAVRDGALLDNATVEPPILFPIMHLLTNQSWGQLMGYQADSPANAYPIIIRDAYDRGFLSVLMLPDNIADLYRLPLPALNAMRNEILGSFPIHLSDAPAQVSLFAYDNNSFVVQSFLDHETTVTVAVAGRIKTVTDLLSSQVVSAMSPTTNPTTRRGGGNRSRRNSTPQSQFKIAIPPHSYRAFSTQTP